MTRLPRWINGAHRARAHPPGGLTLFEVLLALAIFVVAMAAVGQATANGVRAALRSRWQTQAVLHCQSKLAELVAGAEPLQPVARAPLAADPLWEWSLRSEPTPTPGLVKLEVTVQRQSVARSGQVTVTMTRLLRERRRRDGGSRP
jgi:type II secretion system protein I